MVEERPPLWKSLTRAAILVGVLLMLIGLAVYDIVDSVKFWSATFLSLFGTGAALLLAGVFINREWLWRGIRQRKFLVGLNVWAMVILSLVLLLVANAIVAGTPQTDNWFADMTKNRLYSLSEQTRNILKGLNQDVKITVLLGEDEEGQGIGSQVADMVRLYCGQTRRVQKEILDAYREKTKTDQLALRLKGKVEPNSLVVECGEKNMQISFNDLMEYPPMNPFMQQQEPTPPGFKGEEKLTSAIVKLTEEKQATVYFLVGHGELAPEGAEGQGLNQFSIELKRDNYKVETLNLMQTREVPADCDLLVIAGPTTPFEDKDVELLRGCLERNGKLLVFVRPRPARGNMAGLDRLLADYNVKVNDNEIAIEVYRSLFGGQDVGDTQVAVQDYGNHPITEDLKTLNCVMQTVCPVEALAPEPSSGPYGPPPSPRSPYRVTPLMRSSARSWGETDFSAKPIRFDPNQDEKGPLSLAVAVERNPRGASPYAPPQESGGGPRLVVVGSPSIASDNALGKTRQEGYEGDRTFVMNSVNWLMKKESKLGIPPQRPDRRELSASPAALKAVFFITVLAMPLAAILGGGLVWWVRRRS